MANFVPRKNTDNKENTEVKSTDNKSNFKKRERQPQEEYKPGHYMTPEWEKRHEELLRDINANNLPMVPYKNEHDAEVTATISFRRFAKTDEERAEIKSHIRRHSAELRKYGINPKRQMNVTIDDILNVQERLGKRFKVKN
jgi:hypothetical protein